MLWTTTHPVDNAISRADDQGYSRIMTAQHPPSPRQSGLLTLSDWTALPEEERFRIELQEGVLQVSPRPRFRHQASQARLVMALNAQIPDGLLAVTEIDVILDASEFPTVRIPDLAVLSTAPTEPVTADQLLLAVEIVSPGSRRLDTVMKRSEYEDAGVPHYWILHADRSLTTLRLGPDGVYAETAPRAIGAFHTDDPFPVDVDLAAL